MKWMKLKKKKHYELNWTKTIIWQLFESYPFYWLYASRSEIFFREKKKEIQHFRANFKLNYHNLTHKIKPPSMKFGKVNWKAQQFFKDPYQIINCSTEQTIGRHLVHLPH